MSDGCPYSGNCPHISCLRSELVRYEEDTKEDYKDLRKMVSEMRRTLYVIAGILFAELGVMIL